MKNFKIILNETETTAPNTLVNTTEYDWNEQYRVRITKHTYESGRTIEIKNVWKITNDKYIPEIYYTAGVLDEEEKVEIQTKAYGSKNEEEIQKIINGYQIALEAIKDVKELLNTK